MTVGAPVPRRVLHVLIGAVFVSATVNAQVRSPGEAARPSVVEAEALDGVRPSSDLAGFLGRPVEKIQIVSLSRRWAPKLELRRVRVGDTFSGMVTRRALAELAGT